MANITCGNCKSSHESVEQVKACYSGEGSAVAEFIAPSDAQVKLIAKLRDEKDMPERLANVDVSRLDKRAASSYISALISCANKPKPQPAKVAVPPEAIAAVKQERPIMVGEGMYRMNEKVYKVQVGMYGSGRLYAKVLKGKAFQYERGAIFLLRPEHRMTMADASEFGRLYGQCCVCGRTLTDEVSIANGIGPVCAGKGFWSQEERDALAARTPAMADSAAGRPGRVTMSRKQFMAQFRAQND